MRQKSSNVEFPVNRFQVYTCYIDATSDILLLVNCVFGDTAGTLRFTDVYPDIDFADTVANARLALLMDLLGGDIDFLE